MVLKAVMLRNLSLVILLSSFSWAFSQDSQFLSKKESKFVKGLFPEGWSEEALIIPEQQTELSGLLLEGDRVFAIKQKDLVLGFLLSTRAIGRYDYFDYLLAYKPDISVLGLTVTVYRSTHGAAICQKKWLSQFEAYAGEELSYGKDIDALAGATISATALVKDVQRCHMIMVKLREEGLIH